MIDLENLTTTAKIGKILILIGIISSIIGMIVILLPIRAPFGFFWLIVTLRGYLNFLILLTLIKIAGIIVGIFAYKSTTKRDFRRAGKLAIVAGFLPPLGYIFLIGGILSLVSKEAEKSK